MTNYWELSFSLSEAGGEHRWTEREGGNTAGRRQNMGALRAVKAEQLTSDSRRGDSMKSKRASDEVRCTRNDSERMLVPNKWFHEQLMSECVTSGERCRT